VEFGALVKDGIVQLQDACEGVGSTDTTASVSRINWVRKSSLAMPLEKG